MHGIETSESKLMVKCLRSIQENGGKDFEEDTAKWKVRTTHNTFAEVKQLFINHDLVVRDRDKHTRMKAKDAGFHSANNAQEIKDRLTNKMAMAFKELAVATEETINLAVGNKPKPPATKTSNDKLDAALITLTKEVADLKKKRSDGGGGGDGTTTDKAGGNTKKKCKYCGRPHLDKVPEELCCKREENASKVPKWYKRVKAKCETKAVAKK